MKLRKLHQNTSGIVLVTVLMTSMVLMILALGIISINVSQVTSGQRQIDRIKSEQLAQGALWLMQAKQNAVPASTTPVVVTQTLDGKSFTATASDSSGTLQSTVNY